MNDRLYKAFPVGWRSILKNVQVYSTAGNLSTSTTFSYDYVFLPAYVELSNTTTTAYTQEGTFIPWFTSNASRMKYIGLVRETPYTIKYTGTDEPTTILSNNVQMGDIWQRTYNGVTSYLYYLPSDYFYINKWIYSTDYPISSTSARSV